MLSLLPKALGHKLQHEHSRDAASGNELSRILCLGGLRYRSNREAHDESRRDTCLRRFGRFEN
jgi:hypothetical protein